MSKPPVRLRRAPRLKSAPEIERWHVVCDACLAGTGGSKILNSREEAVAWREEHINTVHPNYLAANDFRGPVAAPNPQARPVGKSVVRGRKRYRHS